MKKATTIKLRDLRIMKFGGTSVGDASCIRRAAEIVRAAACDTDLVVVVSAMGGVTNQLLEAAARAEAGDRSAVEAIFSEIRDRHDLAVNSLVSSPEQRSAILRTMEDCYDEGERLYREGERWRELSLRERDAISSLGERLSAPLVAAALAECGVKSQALEATELIVTDSCHGAADPCMDATRQRSAIRLRELLQRGIVPVVTGFIGATPDGVLTTLGRGGSDYSATILGAALEAEEVIIWTDVDGLMTADPKFVDGARTIPEISYQEAAELAHYGAKVLHPKTLRALARCGIPVWIRNTFAPERHGTRITPDGPAAQGGVRGLTAMLRCSLAQDPAPEKAEEGVLDPTAAVVTAVGKNLRDSAIATRMLDALTLAQVNVVAVSEGSSDCSLSVVVAGKDKIATLVALHREFQLDAPVWLSASSPAVEPAVYYQSEQSPANGD
jgi:bifunctional aspartokinase / homoserine dehydrogenase 1